MKACKVGFKKGLLESVAEGAPEPTTSSHLYDPIFVSFRAQAQTLSSGIKTWVTFSLLASAGARLGG